jgi:hypothetical protein
MSKLQLSRVEEEVVFLKAVNDIIDGMVNYEMLALHQNAHTGSVLFQTGTHQRLFNILLVDFLSRSDKRAPVEQTSFLGALRLIITDPQFDVEDSVAALRKSTLACGAWLDHETPVTVWFPSLDKEVELRLPRVSYLKMCGNIAKHDLLRLVSVADELQSALAKCDVEVDRDGALLALGDFYERFHTDILNYHGSTVVKLLNDVRWGIHEYLLPEFKCSYTQEGCTPPLYKYTYPAGITNEFARQRYWDLMNDIRRKPFLPKFEVADSLRSLY